MKSIRILISGLLPHDSGKTTVAKEIARFLREKGFDIGVSKPIAGHSLWYQADTFYYSIDEGILLGHDVVELRRNAGSDDPYEIINPLDIATMPYDVARDGRIDQMLLYKMLFSSSIESSIMIRISFCDNSSQRYPSKHYIVKDNYRLLSGALKKEVDLLIERLNSRPEEISAADLEEILWEGVIHSDRCLEEIFRRHDIVVVESFNDSSAPNLHSLESDVILITTPGRVLMYRGDEYRKVFNIHYPSEMYSKNKMISWPTTRDLIRFLKPLYSIELPHKMFEEEFEAAVKDLTDMILEIK
ncbi:MAG: hypothetical protein QXJ51_03520 [Sulfolobales archaeon]